MSLQKPTSRLAVKAEGRVHLLPYQDIIWVEAHDYMKIHTKERYYLVRDSMKNMERNLPKAQFVRIHKSGIIKLHEINTQGSNVGEEVLLNNELRLKVNRNYRDHFKEKLSQLYIEI